MVDWVWNGYGGLSVDWVWIECGSSFDDIDFPTRKAIETKWKKG